MTNKITKLTAEQAARLPNAVASTFGLTGKQYVAMIGAKMEGVES